MTRALFIPTNLAEPPSVREVDSLASLQAAVGGYVEAIKFTLPVDGGVQDVTLLVNEDGKQKRLPRNERATALVRGFLFCNDCIVGDALLVGPTRDGDFTDVPPFGVNQ